MSRWYTLRRVLLLLFSLFAGFVMSDHTSARSTDSAMMAGLVSSDPSHRGTFHAPGGLNGAGDQGT